jgi:hypothetical protein
MAADRSRLAAALAYEEERRRRMMESVPGLVTDPAQPAPRADFRTNLENLSIGLGRGVTTGLEGVKSIITDPVGTARGVYEAGKAVIRDPSVIADALRYTAEKATSGPLGAGEVIGEMVSPTRGAGGVGKRDIFIGKSAKTYDPVAEQRAIEMEKAGVDRDTIWRETGTGRAFGPDWKQEISDLSAEYRPGAAFAQAAEQAKEQADQFDDALYIRNRLKSLGIDAANSAQEVENLTQNAEQWFLQTFGRRPKGSATDIAKNQTADEIQGRLAAIEKLAPQRGSFSTKIGSVLEHEGLKKAYPGIGDKQLQMASPSELGLGVEGSYSPVNDVIKLRDDIGYQLERGKDVLLHELQHAVQQREGFPRGGNTDIARQALEEQFGKEMLPFQKALTKRLEATSKSSIASRAQYAQKLKELQQKQDIKPRELTRLSDWYQYGTKVSQELNDIGLGWQMPREKGVARDKWIQQAVRIMQRMIEEKDPVMRGIENAVTPNQARSLVRKTNKVLSETQEDAVKAAKVQEKYRELNAKSDFDLYRRLAGEAEARAVQKRMNMNPIERRQTPPWQSLDVPEQEFIYRR